jgi:hypothetical protein
MIYNWFRILGNRSLLKECVEALKATLPTKETSDKMEELFESMYPITRWGKIDWDKIDQKIKIGYDPNNIIPALEQLLKCPVDKRVYIEWDDGGIPVIESNLDAVISSFDEICRVSFEAFIFNPQVGYIIEKRSSFKITVGLVKPYETFEGFENDNM